MHLLLNYSQTNRYLKIQNSFSTKKHPIYYSYDPQTYETYLTKVVQSKDPRVINYYKHHINSHILPYLKMKRQAKNASILSIPIENAEVVIKIDEEERIKKQNIIKEKISEVVLLLTTYKLFHPNKCFQDQLRKISPFINKLSMAELSYKIQCINQYLTNIPHLLTYLSQIKLSNQASERIQSLILTEKQQSQQQNFKDAVLLIDKYEGRQGIITEGNVKPHQLLQIKNAVDKSFQYLSSASYNLKNIRETQVTNAQNAVEELYHQLIQHEHQLQVQSNNVYQANVLFITKKFIKGKTLREMIIHKDERLTPQFCFDLAKTIVDFIFMNGGVKDLFITTQNIIVEDCGTFHLNYFSFVGLDFIKLDKFVHKNDFQEIMPYLHLKYLEQEKPTKDFDIMVQLRFIIINFVSAFFKRDFIFDPKEIDFEVEVRNERMIQQQVDRMQKKLMSRSLSKEQRTIIKREFDNVFKVSYSELVESIFNRDKWQGTLSWEVIFSKLSKCKFESQSQILLSQQKAARNSIVEIANQINCLNYPDQYINDLFYLIDISVMEVFDHYGHILQQLCKGESLGRLSKRNRDRIAKIATNLQYQRKYFIDKGWYYKQIYIPVKMQMTYTQILNYSNWVHMLHSQKEPNVQIVKAVESLLACLLQMQEIMKIVEQAITDAAIQQSLKEIMLKYSNGQKKSNSKSYYSILLQFKNNLDEKRRKAQKQNDEAQEQKFILESDEDEEEEKEEEQSFKQVFWKAFFSTIIITLYIIKKYYIRVNEIAINGQITINGDKYIRLLQQFKPQIPEMSVSK